MRRELSWPNKVGLRPEFRWNDRNITAFCVVFRVLARKPNTLCGDVLKT